MSGSIGAIFGYGVIVNQAAFESLERPEDPFAPTSWQQIGLEHYRIGHSDAQEEVFLGIHHTVTLLPLGNSDQVYIYETSSHDQAKIEGFCEQKNLEILQGPGWILTSYDYSRG